MRPPPISQKCRRGFVMAGEGMMRGQGVLVNVWYRNNRDSFGNWYHYGPRHLSCHWTKCLSFWTKSWLNCWSCISACWKRMDLYANPLGFCIYRWHIWGDTRSLKSCNFTTIIGWEFNYCSCHKPPFATIELRHLSRFPAFPWWESCCSLVPWACCCNENVEMDKNLLSSPSTVMGMLGNTSGAGSSV